VLRYHKLLWSTRTTAILLRIYRSPWSFNGFKRGSKCISQVAKLSGGCKLPAEDFGPYPGPGTKMHPGSSSLQHSPLAPHRRRSAQQGAAIIKRYHYRTTFPEFRRGMVIATRAEYLLKFYGSGRGRPSEWPQNSEMIHHDSKQSRKYSPEL
jgi:hypothetical protein